MVDDNAAGDDRTQSFAVISAGTQVSQYKVIERIGAGGMGEVYLAEDSKLNRRVALKFLPAQFANDPEFKARFSREAQAAAPINHPNVATIYEVGDFQGRPFFAMELVDGRPLNELIKQGDSSLEEVNEIGIQICEGLHEAHATGVVHRDIKPSNILMSKRNRPKLVDFGLAVLSDSDQLTKTGSTVGTLGYMSPEQVQGKAVDQRSDLF